MTYLSLNCAPADMSIPVKKPSTRPVCCWLRLNVGEVKFNVDGASIGKPGPAGIGWILRDHLGQEMMRFLKSIGVADSNIAEFMAIREAFIILLESPWVSNRILIQEKLSTG
ncbi:hypothetical protein PTKIN_Ptkin14bG0163800 [Pterospermum kingtungense]